MKKTTIITIISIFAFALPAIAATTVTLSPGVVNTTSGRTFTVTVGVNAPVANMVEKMEISYPTNILEVVSFTQSSNWMALTQPGYDSNDNINGILTKTAGYPGGLTGSATFGTVTFRAKQVGSGIIKLGSNSQAFEASSQSAINGNSVAISVVAPVYVPAENTPVKQSPASSASIATTSTINASSTQVAVAQGSGTTNGWMWISIIVAILAVVGWGMYVKELKTK